MMAAEKATQHPAKKGALRSTVKRGDTTSTQTASSETPLAQLAAADPKSASAAGILALQQRYGNRAVQRLLNSKNTASETDAPLVQPKLTVGPAGDAFEQEAERVAEQVTRRPAAGPAQPPDDAVQPHREPPIDDDQPLPAISRMVQRHSMPPKKLSDEIEEDKKLKEEEESGQVRRQPQAPAKREGAFEAGSDFESRIASRRGKGLSLPAATRADMEGRIGADFNKVRVHADGEAARLNRQINAQAFTHGADIYFGANNYQPGAGSGKRLLAHELTHVVQQGGAGRISPKRGPFLQRKSIGQWWRDRKARKELEQAEADRKAKPGNVRAGDELPQIEELAVKKVQQILGYDQPVIDERAAARSIADILQLIKDDGFMSRVVQAAQGDPGAIAQGAKGKPAPDMSYVPAIRLGIEKHFATANPKDLASAFRKVSMELLKVKDGAGDAKVYIVNHFSLMAAAHTRSQAEAEPAGLRPERVKYGKGRDTKGTVAAFMRDRRFHRMQEVVPDDEKPKFAAALKAMPTVQYLLAPKYKGKGAGFRQSTGWKDGGALTDKNNITGLNDMPGAMRWIGQRRLRGETFKQRLAKVDRMVRIMVEPEFLAQIPKPKVTMHAKSGSSFLPGLYYRANAGKGKVDLAYDEATNVMAHELGHILEEYLPMKRWHDIHMLLGARHTAVTGGDKRAVPGSGGSIQEGRYAGKYVTGKYTSTAYKFDNAEVVSMGMQFFYKPADALKLIDGDPQHSALILRGFRNKEYKATSPLRAFDKYLPKKDKSLVEKAKEEEKAAQAKQKRAEAFERARGVFERYDGMPLAQMLTTGDLSGHDLLQSLEELQGEELEQQLTALTSANSAVSRGDLMAYV